MANTIIQPFQCTFTRRHAAARAFPVGMVRGMLASDTYEGMGR